MTEPTLLERYARLLENYLPPEDLQQLLRKLGTVEEELARREALGDIHTIRARNAALDEIREERRSTRWIFKLFKDAAAWVAVVGVALSTLGGGYLIVVSVLRALDRQPQAQVEQDSQP